MGNTAGPNATSLPMEPPCCNKLPKAAESVCNLAELQSDFGRDANSVPQYDFHQGWWSWERLAKGREGFSDASVCYRAHGNGYVVIIVMLIMRRRDSLSCVFSLVHHPSPSFLRCSHLTCALRPAHFMGTPTIPSFVGGGGVNVDVLVAAIVSIWASAPSGICDFLSISTYCILSNDYPRFRLPASRCIHHHQHVNLLCW